MKLPEEEGTEPKELPECYMNMQDPELPREELKKLILGCPIPPSGDATIPDATYETSDEACLRLLHQNDDLKAENNHLRQ
jgi:hypothetical protein